MNAKKLEILEQVFTDEINCSKYPTQLKGKMAEQLCEDGYLERVTTTLGGSMPVIIEGYVLTHSGRYAYCRSCSDGEV
ncbi:hypothetical protein LMG33818_002496 [Halomonadaceae bacterium LMG 33818]